MTVITVGRNMKQILSERCIPLSALLRPMLYLAATAFAAASRTLLAHVKTPPATRAEFPAEFQNRLGSRE